MHADLKIVMDLYANAPDIKDVPSIRKEALECNLSLDFANKLENRGIKSCAQLQTKEARSDAVKHLTDSSEVRTPLLLQK